MSFATISRKEKAELKKRDKRIERLYYENCSGVEIDIMDIGKVFKVGCDAINNNPEINDDELAKSIVDFVQTIRKN